MPDAANSDLQSLTADIISAYVTQNKVEAAKLGEIIADVHKALAGLGQEPEQPVEDHRQDKSSIRKSVTDDHIISFIDGRRYKSLKRHLSSHNTTPDEYRAKYGLPKDYPMVAAGYSAQRSALAKTLGLGRRAAEPAPAEPAPAAEPPAAKRSRKATLA